MPRESAAFDYGSAGSATNGSGGDSFCTMLCAIALTVELRLEGLSPLRG